MSERKLDPDAVELLAQRDQELDDLLASNLGLAEGNKALVEDVDRLHTENNNLMNLNTHLRGKAKGRKQAVSQLNHAVLRLKAKNQSLTASLMKEFGDHLRQKKATQEALAEIKVMKSVAKELNAKLGDPVEAFMADPDQMLMDLDKDNS